MKILSFVEGARKSAGGVGIPAVPKLSEQLACLGHEIVLVSAGLPISGSVPFIKTPSKKDFLGVNDFQIAQYPVLDDHWCFNPTLFAKCERLAREADFIHLHSLYSFPVLIGYLLARKYRIPYSFWPHGVLAPFQRSVSTGKKSIYDRLVANKILANASMIVFTAPGEREETRSLGLKSHSVIIPLGFSHDEFSHLPDVGQFRNKRLHGRSGPVVLFLGRLNAKKGLDILIQAMKEVAIQIPDVILVIAGGSDPPSFGQKTLEWVTEYGLNENTVMTGLILGEEKIALLVDSALMALPSQAENFGHVIFEAMACSRPVVISETLNYAGEVLKNEAGLVVPRDPANFAQAILQLLKDPDLRLRMGINGNKMVKSYSWTATAEKIDRAMKSIVKNLPFDGDLFPE